MKGKCPFGKIKCKECVLYRKGMRYFDDNKKAVPFEDCALNIAVDCLENSVSRSIGHQKAIEGTRNEINRLIGLFVTLGNRKELENKS